MKRHRTVILMMLVSLAVLFGCSGQDGDSSLSAEDGGGTGTLVVSLTDAPAQGATAVYVTIEEIHVCAEAGEEETGGSLNEAADCTWEIVTESAATYNLLELVNGVTETLGVAELPVGTYHQMRLIIGTEPDDGINLSGDMHPHANYLINQSVRPLKVSSGERNGIKLVKVFEIEENRDTELILDFDAGRSIVTAGGKDEFILQPVIRVMDTKKMTRLTGIVNRIGEDMEEVPIEAASVSAQRMDETFGLVVEASTITDATGGYQLLLDKDKAYTIVVFSADHAPACDLIDTDSAFFEDIGRNFTLDASDSRRVTGTITGVADGSDVTLRIRQVGQGCGNGDQPIEILHRTFAYVDAGAVYEVTLPLNREYRVFCSDGNRESFENLRVEPGAEDQTLDFVLGSS